MLRYPISLAVVLAIIWLLFSGLWTHPIILPLGLFSVVLTVYLAGRMGIVDREGHPLHLLVPSIQYWPWLLVEITKSNVAVIRHILAGEQSLSPRIAKVSADTKSPLGKTIFANSITLTPGTVTLHVRENEIWFYALSEEIEKGVTTGEMNRRCAQFEGAE